MAGRLSSTCAIKPDIVLLIPVSFFFGGYRTATVPTGKRKLLSDQSKSNTVGHSQVYVAERYSIRPRSSFIRIVGHPPFEMSQKFRDREGQGKKYDQYSPEMGHEEVGRIKLKQGSKAHDRYK